MDTIRSWYDNIGTKIKTWAIWIFIIEALAGIISGIFLMIFNDGFFMLVLVGIAIIVFVPVIAFVGSWLLYGFGELIEKTCEIARNTHSRQTKSQTQSNAEYERISKLERLRSQGLITEEEYQKAISKK